MKNRSLIERTGFALAGWYAAFRRERSFRAHVLMVALAVAVLLVLRPEPLWWAIIAIICALVAAIELVNSAIEALADLLHPDVHPEIKAVKDMVAGAVLAVSVGAIVVAAALVVDHWSHIAGALSRVTGR
ncbi:MAG: diacylglycerol kinase [Pseudomonadota bacterium]|jgi:undecaprenol kinase|uniref:diacylglycerol kinase n=1 Tax=Sphingomonas sp. TaxID=28214 RepID=UPI0025CC5479|nr:diacylglycerol kinase [Sphingomonas sp.]MDQ2763400.1 diacylglycerol kinase [Pseudomonadota bacterium]